MRSLDQVFGNWLKAIIPAFTADHQGTWLKAINAFAKTQKKADIGHLALAFYGLNTEGAASDRLSSALKSLDMS